MFIFFSLVSFVKLTTHSTEPLKLTKEIWSLAVSFMLCNECKKIKRTRAVPLGNK